MFFHIVLHIKKAPTIEPGPRVASLLKEVLVWRNTKCVTVGLTTKTQY